MVEKALPRLRPLETLRLKEFQYFILREEKTSVQYSAPMRMSHYMMCDITQRQSTKME